MPTLPSTLLQQLGGLQNFDCQKFEQAHSLPVPSSIRIHPIKGIAVNTQEFSNVPWCGGAYYLPQRPIFTLDPLLHAGAYYVQEASSMFLQHILQQIGIQDNRQRVLDLCAAPGGKSTLIASLLANDSLLLSNEVIRTRAGILEENISRWGYTNTWVCSNDPRDVGRLKGYFDFAIVDAPCSGSGLFRKDARALDEWSEANVQLCSERQQRILADIWPALKRGGYLIYSTCSYSQAENEDILDFLADQFALESVPVAPNPDWGILVTQSPKHQLEAYRFSPERLLGEGFFVAVLRKKEPAEIVNYPKFKTLHNKRIAEQAAPLFVQNDWAFLEKEKNIFTCIDAAQEPDWHYLRQFVYLRKAGVLAGSPSAKEWLPEHDIALSIDANNLLPSIELSLEDALRFLKKENFETPTNTAKGWYIVRYKGQGLGWIKALGNRVNNYLPKNWRIRMDIDFESL